MSFRPAFFARPPVALAVIVIAILLDQAVKLAVEAYLPFQQAVPVMPMLALYRTYNLGVAFSMLSEMSGWFIVVMRIVIVMVVLWLWRKVTPDRTFAHLGFSLIIAGALGNLIDGFAYGHVIDYVLFHTDSWSFAVFNLADSFITIGAGFILLDEVLASRRKSG